MNGPCFDAVGTVRSSSIASAWVLCSVLHGDTQAPWVCVLSGERVSHVVMYALGLPVVGAVPCTPAWEALCISEGD